MELSAPYRDLLLADLALVLGIAPARDVALALQHFWEQRDEADASLLDELRSIARLSDEDCARLEEEVERAIAEAGDARTALGVRGGIDRSIHLELSVVEATLAQALTEVGAGARAPLRIVPDERYIEFSTLGHGGMGLVYLALDTELNRRVALKIVRPDQAGLGLSEGQSPLDLTPPNEDTPASEAFRTLTARFLQEAWVTGGLEHPGIVPVYELGQTPAGVPYYTMRFVKGERTLETAIREAETLEDRLALLEPFLRVCDTMSYSHSRGVIHRDLKPENIALGEFGEVVILDWGLAKLRGRPDLGSSRWQERINGFRDSVDLKTVAGALGTPGYMAPEAVLGDAGETDERSDVYSLGAILYRILAGRLPYEFTSFPELVAKLVERDPLPPHELDEGTPVSLSVICTQALAREPARRFEGPGEVAGALRAWQRESARERELASQYREAASLWAAAEHLSGAPLLQQLDAILSRLDQILQQEPGHGIAISLRQQVLSLRELSMRRREAARVRAAIRRVGILALLLIAALSAGAAILVEKKRRLAEQAEARTRDALTVVERERDHKTAALRQSRARGLCIASEQAQADRPTLALLLAIAAAEEEASAVSTARLRASIQASTERRILHGGGTAEISADGYRILTRGEQGLRLWDLSGKQLAEIPTYGLSDPCILIGSDRVLGCKSFDPVPRLIDLSSKVLAEFRGHSESIFFAAYSPASGHVLTKAADRTARLWKLTGECVAVLSELASWTRPCFSPDGSHILVSSADGQVHLCDLTGACIVRFDAHMADLGSVAFSPSGNRILTLSGDDTVRIWDSKGTRLTEIKVPMAWSATFTPQGDAVLVLTSSPSNQLVSSHPFARLFSLEGDELTVLVGLSHQVNQISFSPSGDRLLCGSADGTASIWTLRDGDRCNPAGSQIRVFRGHRKSVESAAFLPTGEHVLTGSLDGTARIWGVDEGEGPVFKGHERRVNTAVFSPDGNHILTGSSDNTARLWRLDGELAAEFVGHRGAVYSAAFSPDGRKILTGAWDRTARLWDLEGKELATLSGHTGPVRDVAFSPAGDSILTADTGSLRLWSKTGEQTGAFMAQDAEYRSVGFSTDGTRIITCGSDGVVRVLDVAGPELAKFRISGLGEVCSVEFSPSGQFFLTSMDDGTAVLWDMEGTKIVTFRGHGSSLFSAAFSPDGVRIATASNDETARLWDLQGSCLAVFKGHLGPVRAVSFSPAGDRLVTSSNDGTARIWLLNQGDLLSLARRRVSRDLHDEERWAYRALLGD